MATNRQHDTKEYYMMEDGVDITDVNTIAYFPIPRNGYVDRVYITNYSDTYLASDTVVSFELQGNNLLQGGSAGGDINATLTLLVSGTAIGRTHVLEFPKYPEEANNAFEVENSDLLAAGGCLEVTNNGGGADGRLVTIVVVIRRY